jgi:hypothetical protein
MEAQQCVLCIVVLYPFQQYETHLYLHVKCPILLSDFNQIGIFLNRFSLKCPKSNFMEIRQVRAALIHTGRRTYMTKLIDTFRGLREGASAVKLQSNRMDHAQRVNGNSIHKPALK